jgi:membrane associated rhomboid family serine protease
MFFFILPVGVDYRTRRYPVVTFTLMGICIALYVGTLLAKVSHGSAVDEWVIENLWLVPAENHWWTYFTSLFVHAGFFHLAGNMVYLFLFGACVEDWIGRIRFVAFYLACGLAACFAHIAFSPSHFASELPLGGASGAISGCIGGFLLLLARTRIEFKWVFFLIFRLWSGEFFLPAWLVISGWFLEDVAGMVMNAASEAAGVAFGAHVGGTVFGIALMLLEKLRLRCWPERAAPEDEVQTVARAVVNIHSRPEPLFAQLEIPNVYLFIDEAQTGPFTLSQIAQMFADRTISEQTLYWQEGMDEWRSVEELRQPGLR